MDLPQRPRTMHRHAVGGTGVKNLWAEFRTTPWSVGLIGLWMYIFAIVTYRFPIGTAGATIAIAGALLLLPPPGGLPRPAQVLIAFLLWAFITSIASPWSPQALDTTTEFAKVVTAVIAASVILASPRAVLLTLGWFLACFVFFPIRGAIIGGDSIVGRMVWNYIYSNPNDLAALTLLSLGVALALVHLRWRQIWMRPALWCVMALQFWVIMRTQSRGAALGLAMIALSALAIATPKTRRKLLVRSLIVGVLAFPFVPQETLNRYVGGTFAREAEVELDKYQRIAFSSREERLRINNASWQLAASNLAVGVGFGAFPSALAQQDPELGARDTHNTYLNVLCETGVIGLLLFLAFLWSTGREVLKGLRHTRHSQPEAFQALVMFSAATIGFWTAALFGTYVKLVPPLIVMTLLVSFSRSLIATGSNDGPVRRRRWVSASAAESSPR